MTVDDIRQLMGASTPHFALQLRNRIRKLIAPLPPGDPARVLGEAEIARLERQANTVWAMERRLLEAAGLTAGMHVLDLGCGPGFLTAA